MVNNLQNITLSVSSEIDRTQAAIACSVFEGMRHLSSGWPNRFPPLL